METAKEPQQRFDDHRVVADAVLELLELRLAGEFAVQQ
jgi:hypothetical protein